jgi:hypothetical protein
LTAKLQAMAREEYARFEQVIGHGHKQPDGMTPVRARKATFPGSSHIAVSAVTQCNQDWQAPERVTT